MKIHPSKVIAAAFLFFLLVFPAPTATQAQTDSLVLTIDLSTTQAELASQIEMRVLVSAQEPVNAFDISLEYSGERFEFLRASTTGSIVSAWQSLPLADEQSGSLRLVGGMVSPFLGENGQIITLIFRATSSGDTAFSVSKADFALADGKGTPIHATIASRESIVSVSPEPKTVSPPKIVETTIVQDPLTKTPIVSVKTEDEGAVAETRVRNREWLLWSDWQKTRLPAAIPKYSWTAQIAAIGWDGSESVVTLYRWNIAALKGLLVFAALAVLGYASRRLFELWKIKKRKT